MNLRLGAHHELKTKLADKIPTPTWMMQGVVSSMLRPDLSHKALISRDEELKRVTTAARRQDITTDLAGITSDIRALRATLKTSDLLEMNAMQ